MNRPTRRTKPKEVNRKRRNAKNVVRRIYDRLLSAYGPQHWWPAETVTEVVVGAILTQNTAWTNVQRAIANLRAADCLSWAALHEVSPARLAELIRPAGTFRVKARRLKAFVEAVWSHGGSLEPLLYGTVQEARERLLSIHGVGPETADSILLYAGGKASFVVDAYTHRVFRRHFLTDPNDNDDAVRRLMAQAWPLDAALFNEYHALLVAVGKQHCRARARCEACPLAGLRHDADR